MFNRILNPEGPFKVHKLNERGMLRANLLAAAFDEMLRLVVNNARPDTTQTWSTIQDPDASGLIPPNTEELKQFIFKLQEASFYAKRAIAVLPENQQ